MAKWVRVYSSFLPLQAHMVQTMLHDHDVAAEVRNENFAPYGGVWAEVWVDADQLPKAKLLIARLEADCADGSDNWETSDRDPEGSAGVP
jgi:hypothetical protein